MPNLSIVSLDVILSIGVALVIFLLLRECVTWYFKLNKISNTLERIEILLEELVEKKKTNI